MRCTSWVGRVCRSSPGKTEVMSDTLSGRRRSTSTSAVAIMLLLDRRICLSILCGRRHAIDHLPLQLLLSCYYFWLYNFCAQSKVHCKVPFVLRFRPLDVTSCLSSATASHEWAFCSPCQPITSHSRENENSRSTLLTNCRQKEANFQVQNQFFVMWLPLLMVLLKIIIEQSVLCIVRAKLCWTANAHS